MEFKKRFKRVIYWLIGIFLLLFIFRITHGLFSYPNNSVYVTDNGFLNSITDDTRITPNIASSKYEYKDSNKPNSQITRVDQKYEKTAKIVCLSDKYEEDEKQILNTIDKNNAIIQFQQKSGNAGYRLISLQIGVPPKKFDSFVEEIKINQNILSISITKKDKTNEYRELNSKLTSLKSTRSSLIELKSKGGKIEEYVQLENRILEIDEQLQELGVQLGNFDSENEFCTVKLSLREGKEMKIGLTQRVKVALEWTIEYYFMLMAGSLLVLGCAYILVLLIDKLNIISKFK